MPDEIQRSRPGRVLSTGASVLLELGVWHPPGLQMCSPTWKLSEPHTIGILMDASSPKHNLSLAPFSTLLSSQENGGGGGVPGEGGAKKFQPSNHSLVFPMISPHPEAIQEPTQSCLIIKNDTLITQEMPRVSVALCQELGSKIKYWNKRSSQCSYHL